MKITAYTDGSYRNHFSTSVSILRTTDTFVGMVVGRQKVRTSYDAELIGILQVLEYLEEQAIDYEKLTIYTDVRSAADMFAELKTTGELPPRCKSRKKWQKIQSMTQGKKVFIFHYKGHQVENNPNKTCDIISRICRECSTDS